MNFVMEGERKNCNATCGIVNKGNLETSFPLLKPTLELLNINDTSNEPRHENDTTILRYSCISNFYFIELGNTR